MRTLASILMFSLLLIACQYDPWANRFYTGHADEKDVAGTYVLDADSLRRDIRVPMSNRAFRVSSSATIVLSLDHRAEFLHVPEDYRGTEACSVTGRGTWQLGKNDSFTVVRARIVNEEKGSLCSGEFAYELVLYGKQSPYKLHITIGDPDSGDAFQFARKP